MQTVTVKTVINAPVEKVWQYFTEPSHIQQWNFAGDDWHCPKAENELAKGRKFDYRMEAKDGSMGFNLTGLYDEVVDKKRISYVLEDGRKVKVLFEEDGDQTIVQEVFETEQEHPAEMQQRGWQMILDNFKRHVENS